MAVTALLPIVIMPWLGVIGSKALCKNYLKVRGELFFFGNLEFNCTKNVYSVKYGYNFDLDCRKYGC